MAYADGHLSALIGRQYLACDGLLSICLSDSVPVGIIDYQAERLADQLRTTVALEALRGSSTKQS